MWPRLFLGWALIVGALPAQAEEPALSPVDPSLLDVGCWYSRDDGSEVFLMWFAAPADAQGPAAVLGLAGKNVPLHLREVLPEATVFRGDQLLIRVLAGEDIAQDCGDECAGSLRRVRLELTEETQAPRTFDAIERCGC